MTETEITRFRTDGGVAVEARLERRPIAGAVDPLIDALDSRRGALLSSSYEYPGRYTRWDFGFADPPLMLASREREVCLSALNPRGQRLLRPLFERLRTLDAVESADADDDAARFRIREPSGRFAEEERSRQPSVFSLVRALLEVFRSPELPHLGLYGAFGYDLAFQFEPLALRLPRSDDQRDVVLYLPDSLLVVDHRSEHARHIELDFELDGATTAGLPRGGEEHPYRAAPPAAPRSDHAPGEYAALVRKARESFARGDLFEVVPGQTLSEPSAAPPSELFRRLQERNPAPYGFLLNLGDDEYLVGASPEMYVRVDGRRVETCPISGTIPRGRDPLGDAEQIRTLLNSEKDESELTMCTDVDRNDKSRICEPGSVRVIGRRQIEMYSRLIHTVDHVEGTLRPEFDALDAFLTHAWAVTVTGAPKVWAMRFIEENERSPRHWYGGAVGVLGFDGNMNTGLTLRTIRVKHGVAQVRVGATLLFDSDPEAEEEETHVKASALLDAIRRPRGTPLAEPGPSARVGEGRRILLVDAQDSFVHTLANYLRQTGAEVVTLRAGFPAAEIDRVSPDLVFLSPGPGRPADFGLDAVITAARERDLPLFGVCLGLQAIAEHFGGRLGQLPIPVHGKPSEIAVRGGRAFRGFPDRFRAGRYHSLFAEPDSLPAELRITAATDDGVVMALEHAMLPIAAVQFHPESILSLDDELGMRLVTNLVEDLGKPLPPAE